MEFEGIPSGVGLSRVDNGVILAYQDPNDPTSIRNRVVEFREDEGTKDFAESVASILFDVLELLGIHQNWKRWAYLVQIKVKQNGNCEEKQEE